MAQYREAMEYLKQVARCVKNRDFKSPAALDLLTNDADRADSGASGTQSGIEIVDRADNSVPWILMARRIG
ncbi:hypothetical protein PF010_g9915 [Phytophthora fragariae]|uniref:Uncharacterized protein n=1 Tax=Phytophthora fragariae TaxID=53985 RepID=A0A6G0LBC3_9STRA|nr:hypothetical protein PF010_g9915 [Phytophthora fragariae]